MKETSLSHMHIGKDSKLGSGCGGSLLCCTVLYCNNGRNDCALEIPSRSLFLFLSSFFPSGCWHNHPNFVVHFGKLLKLNQLLWKVHYHLDITSFWVDLRFASI